MMDEGSTENDQLLGQERPQLPKWAVELISWTLAFMFLLSAYATWVTISNWIQVLRSPQQHS